MEKFADHNKMINRKSFTLIELLVVITIIILFSGLYLATYNNFTQQKNLEKEVSQLVDVLSLAKGKSQASEITLTCVSPEEFGGYRVELSGTDYNFKQCCRDVVTKSISSCGPNIQSYNFSYGISNITGVSTVDFFPLTGGATATTISIKNSSINKCLEVSTTDTGVITVGDLFSC